MTINKQDIKLYIKTGNLNRKFYQLALIIILIPIFIVLITDNPFDASFSNIIISISYVFVIIGQSLTLLKLKKGDITIPIHIIFWLTIIWGFIERMLR